MEVLSHSRRALGLALALLLTACPKTTTPVRGGAGGTGEGPPDQQGLPTKPQVEAGLDAGADDVLTYPVNPDVLAAKVRRALQPRRSLTAVAS